MDEELRRKKKKNMLIFITARNIVKGNRESRALYNAIIIKVFIGIKCTFLNISTCTNKKQSKQETNTK